MSGSSERIVRLVLRRDGDRPASPSWAQQVEDWVARHAVPYGAVQARMTVEYQHGQPVLIRLRVTATEEIITIAPTQRAQRGDQPASPSSAGEDHGPLRHRTSSYPEEVSRMHRQAIPDAGDEGGP